MYLRSLAIRGFKSFARKTVLEFEPGITIIVGPNGSGKSNIADAVMWVLGEQSPTSLRGGRMEDIIFSGSSSLKPVSLAEVSLTLDNSNGDFPLDYSEITITRNVVRGGDSEYRLNNNACRLLDIQELLSDAGVGRTMNAVISQGQLEEVLSCRPEERRDFIEEAGGLLKFRRRREKALRRLARMDEELLRISDVLREVRRQLNPLVRQAGKLEQYRNLTGELSDTRLRLDVSRLRMMQKQWERHQNEQRERKEKLEATRAELAAKAREVGDIEDFDAAWRARGSELRDNLYRLVAIHEQLKALYVVWEEKRKLALAGEPDDPSALNRIAEQNRRTESRRREAERRREALYSLEADLSGRARGLGGELNEIAREVMGLEARLEVLRTSDSGLSVAGRQRIKADGEKLDRLQAERDPLAAEISGLTSSESESRKRLSELEGEAMLLSGRKAGLFERLRGAAVEQAALLTRLDLLSHLDTDGWGVINTAGALRREDPTGGGLGGMLVESLKVSPEHETAIMGFLGPWAFGLLAADTNAIKRALEHLKESRMGQSLFFKGSGGPVSVVPETSGPVPEGALRARDVVEAPGRFNDALDALLEGVFLVDGLEAAFETAERYPRLIFLSPDGDVVSGGSLVKGGSPSVGPAHLELTKSGRERTENKLADCRASVEALELELKAFESREEEMRGEIEAARGELEERGALVRAKAEELASLDAGMQVIGEENEYWSGMGLAAGGDEVDLDGAEARISELRGREKAVSAEHGEVEGRLAKTQGELRAVEAELAALSGEADLGGRREERLHLLSDARSGGEEKPSGPGGAFDSVLRLHSRLLEGVRNKREQVRAEIEAGASGLDGAAGRLRSLRDELSDAQRKHEELRDLIHGEDLSRAELKVRVEQLVERIVDGHKVPLEFALKQYPDDEPIPELERRVEELTENLEHVGPVNPEAITEREALEQRHKFLKEQVEDVEQAKSQLRRVVKQVDREIEEKFLKSVGEVNLHFQEMFSFLFPKGRAEVRLTDPDDLMNTGIELYAQPEGKKLRRISLLSGGETSLTAIAFFFALFKVRPSPFYFLDEVEAALDDVNLHRFLDLVKEFKDDSQLVLITHQKRSMEIADILYGVTMQDDGMSRVVSQKVAS